MKHPTTTQSLTGPLLGEVKADESRPGDNGPGGESCGIRSKVRREASRNQEGKTRVEPDTVRRKAQSNALHHFPHKATGAAQEGENMKEVHKCVTI
ncbi:MAG: hypothetical protein IKO41_08905 [Lachnospiraceae bacterium]|nr:hypothetical protein [Lachnospiraceae bacterium]